MKKYVIILKEAMQGKHAISESTVIDEDGDEVLVLAVITVYVGIIISVVIVLFLIILLHILSLIRNTDRIADINERFRLVNNTYYWYRLNITAIRDENGKPLQILESIVDVDEQRTL